MAATMVLVSVPAAAATTEETAVETAEPEAAIAKYDWDGNGNNLNLANIQVGDIILGDGMGFGSDIMPGKWEHSAIYIGNGIMVEAMFAGVRLNDVDACHGSDEAAIYRVSTTSTKKNWAANHNAGKVGCPYDWIWITYIGGKQTNGGSWYCSELNWAGYKLQGVDIDQTPGWSWTYGYNVAPTEIANDGQTYKIAHGY